MRAETTYLFKTAGFNDLDGDLQAEMCGARVGAEDGPPAFPRAGPRLARTWRAAPPADTHALGPRRIGKREVDRE